MPTSQSSKKTIVAITLGDPGGIGPEVVLKSLDSDSLKRHFSGDAKENVFFLCIGSRESLEQAKASSNVSLVVNELAEFDASHLKKEAINFLTVASGSEAFEIGKVSEVNGRIALQSIELATKLAKNKSVDALVTGPICKEACEKIVPGFKGHTDWLAEQDGTGTHAMMLAGETLRVVLVTTHIPINQVSDCLTTSAILEKIELTKQFLEKHKKVINPKIAVAGLNPHSGEGGVIGREEFDCIIPAIEEAQKNGHNVIGPVPADTLFYKAHRGEYDAVICMYHDQGLAPLKMVSFDEAINVTLGLSFVRTSPDHGTAFDIVGQNKANPRSMTEAITEAIEYVAHSRF